MFRNYRFDDHGASTCVVVGEHIQAHDSPKCNKFIYRQCDLVEAFLRLLSRIEQGEGVELRSGTGDYK